ncbi:MAG TPA: CDP-alcohol phosphatidyltransferase family protein [Gemmatimonadales bacterium]|nr:CDP-alcohol phosphatidyltransferase family protein [Gemmatimonadales bacterium]
MADAFTVVRLPLGVAFPMVNDSWRLVVLGVAGASDLLDGFLARRIGSSRFGPFIDPVADKLFMAVAFGTVLFSGQLAWWELLGVLARDIAATIAFLVTSVRGHASAIPARAGGKAVTVLQVATLFAFVLESPLLRPLAWATAAVALYAIWDYVRAAATASRPV